MSSSPPESHFLPDDHITSDTLSGVLTRYEAVGGFQATPEDQYNADLFLRQLLTWYQEECKDRNPIFDNLLHLTYEYLEARRKYNKAKVQTIFFSLISLGLFLDISYRALQPDISPESLVLALLTFFLVIGLYFSGKVFTETFRGTTEAHQQPSREALAEQTERILLQEISIFSSTVLKNQFEIKDEDLNRVAKLIFDLKRSKRN